MFSTEAVSISSPLIRLTALLNYTTLTRKETFMFTHDKLLSRKVLFCVQQEITKTHPTEEAWTQKCKQRIHCDRV